MPPPTAQSTWRVYVKTCSSRRRDSQNLRMPDGGLNSSPGWPSLVAVSSCFHILIVLSASHVSIRRGARHRPWSAASVSRRKHGADYSAARKLSSVSTLGPLNENSLLLGALARVAPRPDLLRAARGTLRAGAAPPLAAVLDGRRLSLGAVVQKRRPLLWSRQHGVRLLPRQRQFAAPEEHAARQPPRW